MKFTILALAVTLIEITHTTARFSNYDIKANNVAGDAGDPLILTPLIEQNRTDEALAAAAVDPASFLNVTSYSGYLTVNEEFGSNLFFWFFPAQNNDASAPVVLWLEGGPGASSLESLFQINGPFEVVSGPTLKLRRYSWTQEHSVLYIDNPVGTGFSFTNNGYAENETRVGEELYIALQQFFKLFPDLQENEFYITGESYGGKYVPAIGYTILQNNPSAELKINLQGLAIGNGWIDPENQFPQYGSYLYHIGLIDSNARNIFTEYAEQGVQYIKEEKFYEASDIVDLLILGKTHTTLFRNHTGYTNIYNYLYSEYPDSDKDEYLGQFLSKADVRAALHAGNTTFGDPKVREYLFEDLSKTIAPWLSELLNHYRVLHYSGQLDIIVAYPLTQSFLENFNFSGAEEYKTAERNIWYVDKDLAGYVKQAGNFTDVLIRDAGHMAPTDQPRWALDMLTKFTRNKTISENL